MALKAYKPTSPGIRGTIQTDRSELWTGKPEKTLVEGIHKSGGRNHKGHITSRFRGGGAKRLYRIIDFRRNKFDVEGKVVRIEYDPNRTARIALIEYTDGDKAYILAPKNLKAGDSVISSIKADVKPGNAMQLRNMPVGTIIHNIELKAGKGGQVARSAGAYAQLVGRDVGYAQIRLASGEMRMVRSECMATVGAVGNEDHLNINLGKAGRKRHLGRRPHNRGTTMNPVDHPHGGGEGKTAGGRHPVSPWGQPTKGHKTRSNKRTDKLIIRRRNKK